MRTSLAARLVAVAFVLLGGYMTVFPAVAERHTARALADHFNRAGDFPARLWIVDERVGSLLFYLEPSMRMSLTPARVESVPLGRGLIQGVLVPGTLVALPDDIWRPLGERMALDEVVYTTAGRFRIYDAATLRQVRPRAAHPSRR
jgi:hypothetical protein